MTKELTEEERKKIRNEKIIKAAVYQEKMDILFASQGKVEKWDKDVDQKSESAKRMWEGGKHLIESQRKMAQREIDLIIALPEEEWEDYTEHFEREYAKLLAVYNSAVSKIRYEPPTDHFEQIPGV